MLYIESVIDYLQVPWENCVGFSLDNTSANTGMRNSIKSRIIAKNESCYIMGCPCHINHNNTQQCSTAFTSATHFEIEDFCVDMFYYFNKSIKRQRDLNKYYKFCDQEHRQILKHINVLWLNLERAVERILKHYAGLQSYFLNENAPATGGNSEWGERKRWSRLKNAFKNPMTEIYLMFFSSGLPTFTTTNLLLQPENPCIYFIHDALNRFLTQVAGRFMTVCSIKSEDRLSTINLENHKHPADM